MTPVILDAQQPQAIARAAQALRDGALLGLPTETVYGLGADATQDAAVAKIFAAKGRPADHPLIVHVAHARDAQAFACDVPDFAQRLMDAFWPGPLTLILPRRPGVASAAAGDQNSVGLRCPAHAVAQAVLQAAAALGVRGVAAPSANRFGRVSPTTAAHVAAEFGPDLLVLDGGACAVGIESTIVDCTRGEPVLLRPGMLTPEVLTQACGLPVRRPHEVTSAAPKASGTLESHYAPQARVRLLGAEQLRAAWAARLQNPAAGASGRIGLWSPQAPALSVAPAHGLHLAMPTQPQACAQVLFAVLRSFDAAGVAEIWVQTPPEDPLWEGITDRLRRAAAL